MSSDGSPPTAPLLVKLTALGDPVRLRILRLLAREELSVGELARAVQLPQSTVSRHLKLLSEGDWITRRTVGTAGLYALHEDELDETSHGLWTVALPRIGPDLAIAEDDARLTEVLAARASDSQSFFGRIGGEWDHVRNELFGGDFTIEAMLGLLDPTLVVGDLGCGTGNATESIARFVRRVIAVDREPAMLEAAQRRVLDSDNVEFRAGELTALPLPDGELDVAMLFLVLHHVDEPVSALREVMRTVRPGGRILIVDMAAHDRADYRRRMGHLHLGFDEATVRRWSDELGATAMRYTRLRPDVDAAGPGLFVATLCRSN